MQCFRSGSDPDSMGYLDPYPDPDQEEQKLPTDMKIVNKVLFLLSAGCSLLRAEVFSCSLDNGHK